MSLHGLAHPILAIALAPLLLGIITRTKAFFAGRQGQPLVQVYRDVFRLLRKGAVYSRTTSWVFRAGPMVGLAAILMAITIVPLGRYGSLVSFQGDAILLLCLLGLSRFATMMAALDAGSSFESMGASREAQFSALAEPAMLLSLLSLAALTKTFSLSAMMASVSSGMWGAFMVPLALIAASVFVVLLAENCRIPFDDPNTHLELTMIHEVMVLDHSGPDFAMITFGAALKLWLFSALLAGLLLPVSTGNVWLDLTATAGGTLACGIVIGVIESVMARLRLLRVPQILLGSAVLAILSILLQMRH